MNINIYQIAIEVTRNCNLVCKDYCMRGPREPINITKENVDLLLTMINKPNVNINSLLFSGGEPSLNEDIIIYIIDKIITNKIPIRKIKMVTNGHLLSYSIIEAFEKFNVYKKEELKEEIKNLINFAHEYSLESEIPNMTNFARIAISRDKFHKPLSESQILLYQKACQNIILDSQFTSDHKVLKTGLSTIGEEFIYHLDQISFLVNRNDINVSNSFYLTATGYLTTNGDGQYKDMDLNNLGHIQEIDLIKIIMDEVEEKINNDVTSQEQIKTKKFFMRRFLRN